VLVLTHCYDLPEQGAHVPGIACRKHPTHAVGLACDVASSGQMPTRSWVALVPNGKKGNRSVGGVLQVALTKLREGPVGSPLQHVIEVAPCG
jgi:hypothetical protein